MQTLTSLMNHLENNKDSQTLSLAYASVGDDGVGEVARFVRDNVFVKYLDLRGNNIQAKGAVVLANGLKLNRSLRSVNLKWNCVGKDSTGVQALCDVLKSNMTISHLDLRNNRITNVGAKYLGEMLMSNTTITHLDLSWNDLGVDGGLALLDGLKHNNTLVDCQLSGSKVGEETLHEVAFLLRRNRAAAAYKSGGAPAESAPATQSRELDFSAAAAPAAPASQSRELNISGPPAAATGPLGGSAVPPAPSAPAAGRSKKDESSLMLRLMVKEREQVLPEDKLFYQQVSEHIDQLQLQGSKHKQGRTDAEERERLSTCGFVDREHRYTKEIRTLEENLQKTIADKENLQREISLLTAELKRLNEENAQAIRESVAIQEHATAEEEQLRKELRDIIAEKRALQDKLALGQKDLELLEQENTRLRAHVKAFQRDVNEILT
jgi:hypothetical protein